MSVAERSRRYNERHREERRAAHRAAYAANPQKERDRRKDYYRRNRELENQRSREWRSANRERFAQMCADWYASNPEARKNIWAKKHAARRGRKAGAVVTKVDLADILIEHGMTCHLCHEPIDTIGDLHFDHVIPLALGGPHHRDNIRPAHAACNLRKGAKLDAAPGWKPHLAAEGT